MDSAPDPLVGSVVVGRYRVLRKIAEGGMGAIYEAEQLAIGRRVAIKRLHAHLARDPDVVARFEREARAASAIQQEHIVQVIDFGRLDDGAAFMALELLEGRDLAAELRDRGPLPVGRAVRIVSQICDALAAAHAKGIIHRDLKPENVFLVARPDGSDWVKVLDFGISKIRDAAEGAGTPAAPALTRTGTTLGTPYYMAPEQAQGRKDVDPRVDVYALGVLLFRSLAGQHPFDDESFPMLVLKICSSPPPPIRMYREDVPEDLQAVLMRALDKDRAQRFASVGELRSALAPYTRFDEPPRLTGARPTSELGTDELAALFRQTAQGTVGRSSEPPDGSRDSRAPSGRRATRIALWILTGIALVMVALLGIRLARDSRRPASILPVPRPPVARPITLRSTGGLDWKWINPLPRAMYPWLGIHAGGPGLIGLVGKNGAAARIDRNGIWRWATGTRADLHGIAWIGAREAIVAGDGGTLRVLGPEGPRVIESGTTESLHAVVALSATEAIVAGERGTLLRVIGSRATRIDAGTTADLLALVEHGPVVYAAGDRGTIVRIEDGRARAERSGTQATLRGIGGCNQLYAVGDGGIILRRARDASWRIVRAQSHESWTSVSCDRDRAAVVGDRGSVLLVAGNETVRLETGDTRAWYGASGVRGEDTWIAGAGGRLGVVKLDYVLILTAGATVPIRGLTTLAGALVAVGEYGRILREDDNGTLTEATSPTRAGLAAVAALAEDRLVAVGDEGAIVDLGPTGATLVRSPTEQALRDVIASGGTLIAVGADGVMLRGAPGALDVKRVGGVTDLWSVDGTPEDAIAVGSAGAVVAISAAATRVFRCETGATLRSVARLASGTWAAGDGGVVVHIDSEQCAIEHTGGPTLHAVGLGINGRPIAVGDQGTLLERNERGVWEPTDLDVAGASLRALLRTDRYLYIAGTSGVILRHVLLD